LTSDNIFLPESGKPLSGKRGKNSSVLTIVSIDDNFPKKNDMGFPHPAHKKGCVLKRFVQDRISQNSRAG
jgi:hypothetical protein